MSKPRQRILYGLQGDGRGHLSRAEAVVPELAKHHDILIFVTGDGERKLSPAVKNLSSVRICGGIYSPKLHYSKNRIAVTRTGLEAVLGTGRSMLSSLNRARGIYSSFRPELIISDLEPCSALVAFLTQTPFLTLDHQHILTNCRIDALPEFRRDYFFSRLMVKWLVPLSRLNAVTTFFFPPVKKTGTRLFPPLLRPELIAARERVRRDDYILVYHTTRYLFPAIDRALKAAAPEKFLVYNMGREYRDGNVTYKRAAGRGFVDDLASSRAVICNGGHTLISESIFLGKPVLSIPLENNFEQRLNSFYLGKMGFGRYLGKLSGEGIRGFTRELSSFRSGVKGDDFCGNKEIVNFILDLV